MKKLFLIVILILMVASCMTMQQKAEQQWTLEYDPLICYFIYLEPFKTSDEAISILKLSQPNFCDGFGDEIIDFQINPYGILIKTRWEESHTEYKIRTVNTYSWNSGYDTTNVGGYETSTESGYKSYSLIFKKLQNIQLSIYTGSNKAYKWQVIFTDGSDQPALYLRAKDKNTALDIINAVYTLLVKSGVKFQMNRSQAGMYASLLNSNRAMTLGISDLKGVVITSIDEDSPAQKSGLLINDVVTNINGNPIASVDEFKKASTQDGLKKIIMKVIRKNDFNNVTNTYNYEQIEIKIVL